MHQIWNGDSGEFPQFGARARSWRRFEGEFTRWLESPEGLFAQWRARETVAGGRHLSAPTADPGPTDY